MIWTPGEELVTDLRHALAHAPRASAEDRFEAWAWRALLDEDGPALLTRHAAPSHVTASAIVLSGDLTRTALVLHPKIKAWVQPGGHLEDGDSCLADAAAREALEETGLSVSVHPDPVHLSRHAAPCAPGIVDWHLDVEFAAVADTHQQLQVSDESLDVAWFAVEELPESLAPDARRGIERAVATLQQASPGRSAGAAAPTTAPAE